MSYVESEERLIKSIGYTYGGLSKEMKAEIFVITRSIDWPILFSNLEKDLIELSDSLNDEVSEIVNRITMGATARYSDFRRGTVENLKLVENIFDSVYWTYQSKLKSYPRHEYIKFNESKIIDILAESPNLVILFMLSQLQMDTGSN